MLPSREVCIFTVLVTERAARALPLAALPFRRISRMLLAVNGGRIRIDPPALH